MDGQTAMTRLGHSTASLYLDVYAQPVLEQDQRAADAIETHLFPPLRLVTDGDTRDKRATSDSADDADAAVQAPDQALRGGRKGTRTPDLCRVKAAL